MSTHPTSPPRLLLSLPTGNEPDAGSPRALVEIARRAEDAGADGIVLTEHVVLGQHLDTYPWGTFPFTADAPWPDPLTVLAGVAAATTRLLLTTGVLIAPLRPATVLAKQVATLDLLSDGRVELGVGTGWQADEFTAQGLDPAHRGQLLDDVLGACRELWRPGPSSYACPSFSFDGIWCEPSPTRPGGPPVLIGGPLSARNRWRITTLGDGWLPAVGATRDDIARGVEVLRDDHRAAGRDPATLRVRAPLVPHDGTATPGLGATLEAAPGLARCGVTDVTVRMGSFVRERGQVGPWLTELGRRWASLWT